MGEPNVFTFQFSRFFGIGISITPMTGEYGKAYDIYLSLPFIGIGIFTKKTKHNKWF